MTKYKYIIGGIFFGKKKKRKNEGIENTLNNVYIIDEKGNKKKVEKRR